VTNKSAGKEKPDGHYALKGKKSYPVEFRD